MTTQPVKLPQQLNTIFIKFLQGIFKNPITQKNMQNQGKQRYLITNALGEGTYGVVYKALDQITKQVVAVKKIRMENEGDEGVPATTIREISILRKLNHKNIVPIKDIQIDQKNNKIWLIFDYYDQDFANYLYNLKKNAPMSLYQNLMQQILEGIQYCHQRGIMHRDLKPSNILVSTQGQQLTLKIADFGLARAFNYQPLQKKCFTGEIVTLWYRSPEVLLGEKQYDYSLDMWSIGCIFGELLQKKPIFMGDSQIDQLFKIFKYTGTPNCNEEWCQNLPFYKKSFPKFQKEKYKNWDNIELYNDPDCLDLIDRLLEPDPTKRLTASEALQHQFFKNTYI